MASNINSAIESMTENKAPASSKIKKRRRSSQQEREEENKENIPPVNSPIRVDFSPSRSTGTPLSDITEEVVGPTAFIIRQWENNWQLISAGKMTLGVSIVTEITAGHFEDNVGIIQRGVMLEDFYNTNNDGENMTLFLRENQWKILWSTRDLISKNLKAASEGLEMYFYVSCGNGIYAQIASSYRNLPPICIGYFNKIENELHALGPVFVINFSEWEIIMKDGDLILDKLDRLREEDRENERNQNQ